VVETHLSSRTSPSAPGKFLTFVVAGEEYGIEILRVHEIIGVLPITRIPRMPRALRGVVNLRGKVIPIVDLRAALGLPADRSSGSNTAIETCIVVVQVRGSQVGALVDAVSEVVSISADQIDPAPPFTDSSNTPCLLGIARAGDRVRLLLNMEEAIPRDVMGEIESAVVT